MIVLIVYLLFTLSYVWLIGYLRRDKEETAESIASGYMKSGKSIDVSRRTRLQELVDENSRLTEEVERLRGQIASRERWRHDRLLDSVIWPLYIQRIPHE